MKKIEREAADKVLEHVQVETIINLVNGKMDKLTSQAWRTLQNAFARDLKGSYKKLDLFKCFFSKFALPADIIEASIEDLRGKVVTLAQEFMVDEIIATLATESGGGSLTRSSQVIVSDEIKNMVRAAVHSVVNVSRPSQALTLEEATGVLKRGFKGGHKSLKALLYEAQVRSLEVHLLEKNCADNQALSKDRRKTTGRFALGMYKNLVSDNANAVIDGAKTNFVDEVQKVLNQMKRELKSRLVHGKSRGKSTSLPVLLKLRRECFKCIVESEVEAVSESDDRMPLLLEEFSSKFQALLSDDTCTDQDDIDAHNGLLGRIRSRHLLANLERRGIASSCRQKQGKVKRGEAPPLPLSEAKDAIEKMKTGPDCIDLRSHYYNFIDQIKNSRLEVGFSPDDSNSLFQTLNQFVNTQKLCPPDDSGEGGNAAAAADVSSVVDLRSAIVDMVEQKHATPEQREQFEGYYGKPVQGWAREMREPSTPGDEICIEYFARHFKLSFRVYSPVLKRPLQFPTYLDMGGEISSGQQLALSVFRIAHLPCEPGQTDVWRLRFVPLWPAAVKTTTPTGTPVWEEREFEVEGNLHSWKDFRSKHSKEVLQQQQAGHLKTVSGDTDMADASANRDVESIREKQRFKKYWGTGTSRNTGKPYLIHKASGISCFPNDWKQVCDGVHPKVKIPDEYPR